MAGSNGFDAQALILRRLREQRERWIDLAPGLQVQVLVLRETEYLRLRTRDMVEIVCEQAVGWRGFTEAALLGAHDGASDVLPFSTELWSEVARNSVDYVRKVSEVLVADAERVMAQRAEAKNA